MNPYKLVKSNIERILTYYYLVLVSIFEEAMFNSAPLSVRKAAGGAPFGPLSLRRLAAEMK